MPTATWMSASRRGAVALAIALIATVVAPAPVSAAPKPPDTKAPAPTTTSTTGPKAKPGAPSTTLPTTTTTIDPKSVPPPPAFTLPIGLGLELLAQRDAANKDLLTYSAALPGDRAQLAEVQKTWDALQKRLDKLRAQVRKTQHDLDEAHEAIQAAGVEAYMSSGSGRLEAAITALASAGSALDYSRTIHLIGSFGDQQDDLIKEYTALEARLKAERERVTKKKE